MKYVTTCTEGEEESVGAVGARTGLSVGFCVGGGDAVGAADGATTGAREGEREGVKVGHLSLAPSVPSPAPTTASKTRVVPA